MKPQEDVKENKNEKKTNSIRIRRIRQLPQND